MPSVFRSTQEIARQGSGAAPPRRLRAPTGGGKGFYAFFDVTLPLSGLMTGDVIELCRVPAGVALVHVLAAWDRSQIGMTGLGVEGEPEKYAAGFADRLEQWYIPRPIVDVEQTILATNTRAPWTPGSVLEGHFIYVGA